MCTGRMLYAMKAEIKGVYLQASNPTDGQQSPGSGERGREQVPPRSLRRRQGPPCQCLSGGLQPPELRDSTCLLFKTLSLWDLATAALGNEDTILRG